MAEAPRDQNRVTSLLGVSSADGTTTLPVYVDAATNRLLVTGVGGGGTSAVDDAAFVAGSGAGTPAMGFATADTVDAGDVGVLAMDVNRNLKVAVQSGGGGTQYDIQDVAGGTDTGDIALVQRNDVLADLSGGDGAYSPLQVNATGALYTVESTPLTGFATSAKQLADGHNVTVDNGAAGAAVNIQDGGNTITVQEGAAMDVSAATVTVDLGANNDVTTTAQIPGVGATNLGKAEDAVHGSGDTGVMALGVRQDTHSDLAADGDYIPFTIDGDGGLRVAATGWTIVQGNAAHDAADSGNPVKLGGKATTSEPAAVANNDRVDAYFDANGYQQVKVGASLDGSGAPSVDSYAHIAINLTTGADQLLVSSAASKQIWVYGFGITLSVAGTVSFQDEADTAITGIMDFAANSGMAIPPTGNFAMPIWKLATDKDLEVDIVTADVDGWLDYAIVSV